jgi:hypothetical protein
MVFTTILTVSAYVLMALLSVIMLHLGGLFLRRSWRHASSLAAEFINIFGPVGLGAVLLWQALDHAAGPVEILPLPSSLKAAAFCLYLAGCLCYVELHGLLSRGYSLRILVDLLERGEAASMDSLKAAYGGGLGVRGMVVKRVRTLANLRLLHFQDDQVGPLTPLGKLIAVISSSLRALLRLEMVG